MLRKSVLTKCLCFSFFLLFTSIAAAAPAATSTIATYKLDPSHSRIEFRIKHLMVATVVGSFKTIEGTGKIDLKTNKISEIFVSIDPASIDTNEPDRDKDLRSANFFDVEKFKQLTFVFKSATYQNSIPSNIEGMLTIHGVSKPVTLSVVDWGGAVIDPWGNEKLAFEAEGKIDRTDFGLTWNKPLSKAAGVMVGNEVKIRVNIEAIKNN